MTDKEYQNNTRAESERKDYEHDHGEQKVDVSSNEFTTDQIGQQFSMKDVRDNSDDQERPVESMAETNSMRMGEETEFDSHKSHSESE